jgi:hypothetical protein
LIPGTGYNTTDNHRLGSGARLKATYARNFTKPVRVVLRMKDEVTKSPDELLKWIKDLNPGFHTEQWRILDGQPGPKGQRLIFLTDRESHTAIKGTRHKTFTGLSQGTV